jgi:sugar phosphate isomerase/epimerase
MNTMTSRRNFIKGLSTAIAAGLTIPEKLFAFPPGKIIGIQLYTIRELVNKDFEGTLKTLSQIGYNSAEAAGYGERKFYGYEPSYYSKICKDYGILPLSSHSGINLDNADVVIEDTTDAGMSYLVLPSIPEEKRHNLDDYKLLADEFNLIGDKCKQSGLKFGYHNHAFEFTKLDDQVPYNILLERTDPDLCFMQIDFYWMVYGGCNPEDYFNQYPGRFELWHVKDMDKSDKRGSIEIGQGIIDFPELFKQKENSGMKYFFVEQEEFTIDMNESITMSYNYLNTL